MALTIGMSGRGVYRFGLNELLAPPLRDGAIADAVSPDNLQCLLRNDKHMFQGKAEIRLAADS